uniref:Uncharacterized protein n=1 Tax=Myripristis murdjan TaxID=586833 RepID=A0A667Z533_9TELE
MSSMDWPFSSFFSISTSSFTPSTTICTSSTSEKPSLSAFEMSNTPPTAAVSTPPETGKSPQIWGACSCRCPGWRGRSARSPGAHST